MSNGAHNTQRSHGGAKIHSLWPWLPLVTSPFFFGLVIWIFPLDRGKAASAVLVALGAIALLGFLPPNWRRQLPLAAGFALLAVILSIPFWALSLRNGVGEAPTQAIYSYKAAKANPEAFTKWWNFFVAEVVRTNEVVFTRDPAVMPDSHGLRPRIPIPGAEVDFYKGRITINNQGYRGDDFPREKKDVYRIVTIGDSATFGQTLFPDSRPWSSILQDLIARNLRCSKPVQVVNGGVNGYRLRNAIDRIERDFPWLEPDMVLSYFGWNATMDLGVDPFVAPEPLAAPVDGSRASLIRWFVLKAVTSLRDKIVLDYTNLISMAREDDIETKLAKAREGDLYRQYQELFNQSKLLRYSLVLLSFNTAVAADGPEEAKAFYQGAWPGVRSIIAQLSLHNQMIREMAAANGEVHFVDTGVDLYPECFTNNPLSSI